MHVRSGGAAQGQDIQSLIFIYFSGLGGGGEKPSLFY